MRYQGKITVWKNEKGFGFVTMNATGKKAFVHIKSFSNRSKRPVEGDKITYELVKDENNRLRAENIIFADERSESTNYSKPISINVSLVVKLLLIFASISIGYIIFNTPPSFESKEDTYSTEEQSAGKSEAILANAFSNHQSNIQVFGQGIVTMLLPDDNRGSRHQKFIIELSSGQTILIAHNIDLAHRINSLNKGDKIQFYGEYEWNEKGGILHWTHRDPNSTHEDGWLEHEGQRYQ